MELLSNPTSNKLFCYFCLRCNSRKYLNLHGQNDGSGNEEEESVSSWHEFCLRNLYRFLNLLHSDKKEKDFKDIKMMICNDCFRLNDEFNSLYNLLEETKLRLNWSVKKIEDVMAKAAKVAKDNEDTILHIWRTHTLDGMQKFAQASFPLVLLHKNKRKRRYPWIEEGESAKMRMTVEKDKVMAGTSRAKTMVGDEFSVVNNGVGKTIAENTIEWEMRNRTEIERKMENSTQDAISTLPKNSKARTNSNVENQRRGRTPILSKFTPVPDEKIEVPSLEQNLKTCNSSIAIVSNRNPRVPLQCRYCNYETVSHVCRPSALRSMMDLHLVRFHPEHYLINENDKASGLWHAQFHKILRNMIYPSFMAKEGHQKTCTLCEKRYKFTSASRNAVMLKKHLILHHELELKTKLKLILEDPLLDKKLKLSRLPPEKAELPTKCPYCRYKTVAAVGSNSAVSSMFSHFINFHPEHYLIDEKDKAAGLWHDQLANILNKKIYPNLISSKLRPSSCLLCRQTYNYCAPSVNMKMMKRHLIFCHKLELKARLKSVLEDPHLRDDSNNCKIKYSLKCSYCRFECTNASNPRYSMERHLIRFHPEHFFIENDEIPTLRHPQFQRILSEIVFPEYVLMTSHHTECSLCKKEYKTAASKWANIESARKHIIRRHTTELKKSMNDVLEDPMLEYKLSSSSAKGVTCSCGVYLEGHSNSLSTYHKNFHCIKIQGANNCEEMGESSL